MKILIKNGRVIDPASNFDEICDLALAAGRVVGIRSIPSGFAASKVIDAFGRSTEWKRADRSELGETISIVGRI